MRPQSKPVIGRNVMVTVFREARGVKAFVYPPTFSAAGIVKGERTGPVDVVSAVSTAFSMAERYGCNVSVQDPDRCWLESWAAIAQGREARLQIIETSSVAFGGPPHHLSGR